MTARRLAVGLLAASLAVLVAGMAEVAVFLGMSALIVTLAEESEERRDARRRNRRRS